MITLSKAIKGSFQGVDYPNDKQKLLIDKDGKTCQMYYNLSSNNSAENWKEMKAISKLSSIKKPFLVVVLSPPAEVSKNLKFEDWRNMAEVYAKEFGFNENQWRWDIHKHDDTKSQDTRHMHIYANRIDFRGNNTVIEGRIGLRSNRWAEKFCREIGWKTLGEMQEEKKTRTRGALVASMIKSTDFDELRSNLSKYGYTFNLSYSNSMHDKKKLNGMRIMTISEAIEREKRESITYKAVSFGRSSLTPEIRNKSRLSPIEQENAKQAGLKYLSHEEQKLVLSKAEIGAKPGFTLSQLNIKGQPRLTVTGISDALMYNAKVVEEKSTISFEKVDGNNFEEYLPLREKGMLEVLLQPTYTQSMEQDPYKKKKKKYLNR